MIVYTVEFDPLTNKGAVTQREGFLTAKEASEAVDAGFRSRADLQAKKDQLLVEIAAIDDELLNGAKLTR
jgi:hypothetical protein